MRRSRSRADYCRAAEFVRLRAGGQRLLVVTGNRSPCPLHHLLHDGSFAVAEVPVDRGGCPVHQAAQELTTMRPVRELRPSAGVDRGCLPPDPARAVEAWTGRHR